MSMKMKKYVFYPVIFLILVLIGATMLFPFLWMVIGSLKPKAELFAVPMNLFPSTWMWKNYGDVLKKIPFVTFYVNTAKIAVFSTMGQVITCALSAYAFAKLRFKGRDFLFMLYLATMMIPYQVTMIPQYELMNKLNLLNSHAALIILHCFSPFGVFLLRQFFVSIPDSLIEAARIDGAKDFRILSQIVLPLSKSALATLVTLKFLDSWNEFTGPLIFLNEKEKFTLQVGIRMFQQENGTEYTLIMAATTMSLIPIVLLYVFAQKYFIEGIAAAWVKG